MDQLQCTAWPDMEAPKDTKTLLDLLNETEAVRIECHGRFGVDSISFAGVKGPTRHYPGPL